MVLQLFTFLVFFAVLFFTSLIQYFLNYSLHVWAQIFELEPYPIIGNISAVNTNYTVGVNDNLLVSLAFINPNTTDETIFQDGIHFISVICPIRSPVVVLPMFSSTNFEEANPDTNLLKLEGTVFCQTSNISDLNSTKSVNEQLADAKLVTINCSKIGSGSIFTYSQSARNIDC